MCFFVLVDTEKYLKFVAFVLIYFILYVEMYATTLYSYYVFILIISTFLIKIIKVHIYSNDK